MQSDQSGFKRPKCAILGGKEHGLIPGCGVNLKRDRSSLDVKLITLNYTILSNKAFFKKKTRKISLQTFTHWLPLYLGNLKKKAQHIELMKRALTLFKTDSTTYNLQSIQETIIEIYPKLISNTLYDVTSSYPTNYNHIAFTYLMYLFASFSLLQQEFPDLQNRLAQRIERFMSAQENRIKSVVPSLGDILSTFLLCQKYTFKSPKGRLFLDIFLKQQSDRHVLWILKKYPHFATFRSDQDHMRIDSTFTQKKSSYNFLMGACCIENRILTINRVKAPFALANLAVVSHKSNIYPVLTQQFYRQIGQIYQINSYKQFYRYLGKEPPSRPQFLEYLKDSVRRSLAKGYHTSLTQQNVSLPESVKVQEQVKQKPHEIKFKALFDRMQAAVQYDSQVAFRTLLKMLPFKNRSDFVHKQLYKEQSLILQLLNLQRPVAAENRIKIDLSSLLISSIEVEFLKLFQQFPNFTLFYKFLEIGAQNSSYLSIPVLDTSEFKSGHYWVMKAIENHKSLKNIKIMSLQTKSNKLLPSGFLKYLNKGLHNLIEANGNRISLLILNNLEIHESKELKQFLLEVSEYLEHLKLENIQCDFQSLTIFIRVLLRMFKLTSLTFERVNLNSTSLMNISDAALSLKRLSYLKVNSNTFSGQSLSYFLKNMAFLAKLQFLQLSNIMIQNQVPEIEQNLAKLLLFSRSLRFLNLAESSLIYSISPNFCNALGLSSSLQTLILDHRVAVIDSWILGRAIAINSVLKNPLKFISLKKGVLGDRVNFQGLCQALFFNHSYFQAAKAKDFKICGNEPQVDPDGSEKVLHCSLSVLKISGGNGQQYVFEKAKTDQQKERMVRRGKFYSSMGSLSIQDVNFQDEEALHYAFTTEQNLLDELSLRHNKIKVNEKLGQVLPKRLRNLDLSGNNISDNGFRAILPFLLQSSIEDISLYQNNLTLEAAKYLEIAFKEKSQLDFNFIQSSLRRIDLGYNRFRDKGSLILLKILLSHCPNLRVVNLRYNFITTKGCLQLLELDQLKGQKQLCISLMQNKIEITNQLKQKLVLLETNNPSLMIDLAQKLDSALFTPETILVTGFPLSTAQSQISNSFHSAGCTGVSSVRLRVKRSLKGNKTALAFVEFKDKYAAKQALHLASSQKLLLNGKKLKAYRAKESI